MTDFPFLSAISAVKTSVLYLFELKSVSEASRNAKHTLERVQRDLEILRREARRRWSRLSKDTQRDVKQTIRDANDVICNMAVPIRAAEQNVDKYGTVTLKRRVLWTVRDGDQVSLYLPTLQIHQQSIASMINILLAVPDPVDWPEIMLPEAEEEDVNAAKNDMQRDGYRISETTMGDNEFWQRFTNDWEEEDVAASGKSAHRKRKRKRVNGKSHASTDDNSMRAKELRRYSLEPQTDTCTIDIKDHGSSLVGVGRGMDDDWDGETVRLRRPSSTSSEDDASQRQFIERREEDRSRRGFPNRESKGTNDDDSDDYFDQLQVRMREDRERRSRSRDPVQS
ncbi:MAG: hypothetical protein Q9227_008945 [Pyrenula ochraceoflavens]